MQKMLLRRGVSWGDSVLYTDIYDQKY